MNRISKITISEGYLRSTGNWEKVDASYADETFTVWREKNMKKERTLWLRLYSYYSSVFINEFQFVKGMNYIAELEFLQQVLGDQLLCDVMANVPPPTYSMNRNKKLLNIDNVRFRFQVWTISKTMGYGMSLLPGIWWHLRNGVKSQIIELSWLKWKLVIDYVKWIVPESVLTREENPNKTYGYKL